MLWSQHSSRHWSRYYDRQPFLHSLLLTGRLAPIARHRAEPADKAQHPIQFEERGALATLHVLNAATPPRPGGQPLSPRADDEGAGRWRRRGGGSSATWTT